MNSEERKKKRIQRRRQKRADYKADSYSDCDDFDKVFTYEHLYRSYQKCRRGVGWKSSTQKYIAQAPLLISRSLEALRSGKWKTNGFYEFDITERGKPRHIRSVTLEERVVQKCLCDYSLTPLLTRTFIYDNGASTVDKGYHFALRRCEKHLKDHYRKYGNQGYILTFDFKKFFDNVSHRVVKDIVDKNYTDKRLKDLIMSLVYAFGDKGLGLGSQVSQIFALASANRLDHYCKEVLQIHGYGRYMDDGYLIHPSKEHLIHCLDCIKKVCGDLEITLNPKKTQIIKLSHGFTFLKCRFCLQPGGKVVKKIYKKSIAVERRKLKKLAARVKSGDMLEEDLYQSFQSWRAYASNFDAYYTIQNMTKLYEQLVSNNI